MTVFWELAAKGTIDAGNDYRERPLTELSPSAYVLMYGPVSVRGATLYQEAIMVDPSPTPALALLSGRSSDWYLVRIACPVVPA